VLDDVGGIVVNAAHVGIGADAASTPARSSPGSGRRPTRSGRAGRACAPPGWRLKVEVDGRSCPTTTAARSWSASATAGDRRRHAAAAARPRRRRAARRHGVQGDGPFARIRFGAALASGDHLSDPQVRFARGRSVTVRRAGRA
jgi:hypothetical protein